MAFSEWHCLLVVSVLKQSVKKSPMVPESQINFLKTKIEELRSALFFSFSDAVLKMPTTIVTTLKVDEAGQIWFFIRKPSQQLHEFDKDFPARLDFFRKGKNYYMKINGKARIVDDPEEINSLVSLPEEIRTRAMDEMVLVKLKIQHVDYYEKDLNENPHLFQQMKNYLRKWFFNYEPGYHPYSLQSDPLISY